MIAMVTALYSEAEYVLKNSTSLKKLSVNGKDIFNFNIKNKEFVLMVSGIGKVSSAMATQFLIDTYSPTAIINFGTAGGVNDNVKLLSYYAIEQCCQPDFDIREIDNIPLGYIQEFDRVYFPAMGNKINFLCKANLASADRFSNDKQFINDIKSLNCSLRDMEGCAIAQVCLANNVSLYMIKGVSDVYGSGNDGEQYLKNAHKVCKGFPEIIDKLIDLL